MQCSLQVFYLTARHRAQLKAETGLEGWHFEQHADEAVFIPAGCPHQARSARTALARPLLLLRPVFRLLFCACETEGGMLSSTYMACSGAAVKGCCEAMHQQPWTVGRCGRVREDP